MFGVCLSAVQKSALGPPQRTRSQAPQTGTQQNRRASRRALSRAEGERRAVSGCGGLGWEAEFVRWARAADRSCLFAGKCSRLGSPSDRGWGATQAQTQLTARTLPSSNTHSPPPYLSMTQMKAVLVQDGDDKSSKSLYLGQTDRPALKPGDVLVAIKAFGVNRMDSQSRSHPSYRVTELTRVAVRSHAAPGQVPRELPCLRLRS